MAKLKLDDFLPYRLSFTSNLVSEAVASRYAALFGLTIPEWRVIAVVAEHRGVTQQAICGVTRMDKVTVSRATIALADRGLLRRSANPGDRRSQLLSLSEAGADLYGAVAPRAIEVEDQIFSCLSAVERATLTALLRRVDAQVDGLGEGLA